MFYKKRLDNIFIQSIDGKFKELKVVYYNPTKLTMCENIVSSYEVDGDDIKNYFLISTYIKLNAEMVIEYYSLRDILLLYS